MRHGSELAAETGSRLMLLPSVRRSAMKRILSLARRFVRNEDGLELVEYALMAAVVVVVVIVGIMYLWNRINARYADTGDAVMTPATAPTDPHLAE